MLITRGQWLATLAGLSVLAGTSAAHAQWMISPHAGMAKSGAPVTPAIQHVDLRSLPRAENAPFRLNDPNVGVDMEGDMPLWQPPWEQAFLRAQLSAPLPAREATGAFGAPSLNFAGQNFSGAFPADPTGDINDLHYVQAINSAQGSRIVVYNKTDGSIAAGPFLMSALGPNSGACVNGLSDPQVVYDGLANRWLLGELVSGGNFCVYVSATSNIVTTTWFRYEFALTPFADYPKLAVWDTAYAVGANAATVVDAGNFVEKRSFFVLDRARMLLGQPASFQSFDTGPLSRVFFGFGLALPAGLKGNNPPMPGAPVMFFVPVDDELQAGGGTFNDQVLMYTVQPDFNTPANSALAGPISFDISDWSRSGGNAFQSSGAPLPMFTGIAMHRATYRNFGDRESTVLAFTSTFSQDATFGSLSAVRWIEWQRVGGAAQPWSVAQDGEYGRNFGVSPSNRFIPALQMDNAGNMALAYGVMSKGNAAQGAPPIEPSLAYTGRLRGDIAGTMPIAETTIASGVQPSPDINFRWGDYFDLSLDPDGCRFWFTGMYMDDASWGTRIASWRHDQCGPPDFSLGTPTAGTPEVCLASGPQNLGPYTVNVGTSNSFWSDVSLSYPSLPPGITATVQDSTRRPPATTSASIQVTAVAVDGLNTVTLRGVAGSLQHDLAFQFDVAHAPAATPAASAPSNSATNVPLLPTFSWSGVPTSDQYVLEVSTSNTFATLTINQTLAATSFVPFTLLSPNTTYYWRVKSRNQCGDSAYSPVRSFTTVQNFCATPIVPTTVPDGGSLVRTVTTTGLSGNMIEMTPKVVLNNGRAGDYRITLSNGTQSAVLLNPLGAGCTTGSFRLVFDDADPALATCSDMGTASDSLVRPNNALSIFNGHSANATWTLTIEDTIANGVTGSYLFFCVNPIRTQSDTIFANGFE